MANIMSLKNVRNKASRNGFDLSRRTCFTAKVGELLPVWWKYVLPGDSFSIDLSSFTRTQPVNTASYGRIREYYDFFFVPLEQLWNKSHTVLTDMSDNVQHATSLNGTDTLSPLLPCMSSLAGINQVLNNLYASDYKENFFGYDRRRLSCKLLTYLGYGQMGEPNDQMQTNETYQPNVSIYPLLAYQKIYADFFRFSQWESPNPSTFNVDWMKGDGLDSVIQPNQFTDFSQNTMFDLRYCNYQKDLFHGIMPNAQFGSTAAVPINVSGQAGNVSLDVTKSDAVSDIDVSRFQSYFPWSYKSFKNTTETELPAGRAAVLDLSSGQQWMGGSSLDWRVKNVTPEMAQYVSDVTISGEGSSINSATLSILALRQAEALQRWKEVAQAAEEDYKSQIQAHWGVNVSDLLSGQARYLGGHASSININEVVNTNLVNGDTDQPADLAGKGVGSLNGKISFNSQGEYGVIMCIYHALPILDYVTTGTDLSLFHVTSTSFPIPEFDSIGMELLPWTGISNSVMGSQSQPFDFAGYVPRYIDWKTDYDRCVGDFAFSLKNWIIPFSDSHFWNLQHNDVNNPADEPDSNPNVGDDNSVRYPFFKVDPSIVDPMFAVQVDDTVQTDHLLCQSYFKVYVTRNLDVNGLPY